MKEPQRFLHATNGGIQFYLTMSSCEELEIFDSPADTIQGLLDGSDFIFDKVRCQEMARALRIFTIERILSLGENEKYIGGESRLQNFERNFNVRYIKLGEYYREAKDSAYNLAVCFSLAMSAWRHDDFLNPALVESFEWELLKSAFG